VTVLKNKNQSSQPKTKFYKNPMQSRRPSN